MRQAIRESIELTEERVREIVREEKLRRLKRQ